MAQTNASHRQILKASTVIGGASVINIVLGLVRTKIAALLLGPSGVGLIGLLQNLLQAAATLGSLNIGTAGTRQIAAVADDGEGDLRTARRSLFLAAMLLALTSGGLFWALRDFFARSILGDAQLADLIGWLAVGVMLTVAAGYQTALLTGFRRVGDIARVSILSAIAAAIAGSTALLIWGQDGILIFILATPVASFAFGWLYVRKIGPSTYGTSDLRLKSQLLSLLRFGAALTAATFITLGGQLVVRIFVERSLGLEALGHFQAAWMISITYLAFVLQAMSSDYYPRLTAAINDGKAACRIINEQSEVALLLGGPMLIAMLGFAPWLIQILYTADFGEAAVILRWQILGDVLKITSWPLGFILLARGDGRSYMFAEISAVAVLVGATALLLPRLGLQATGVAVLLMYAYYLPLVFILAQRHVRFRWQKEVMQLFGFLIAACLMLFVLAQVNVVVSAIIACVFAFGWACMAMVRLDEVLPEPIRRTLHRFRFARR